MCICLNCNRFKSCEIYKLISKKHKENQLNFSFSFFPQSPIIQILLNPFKKDLFLEWDVNDCLSFEDNPGIWIMVNNLSKLHVYKQSYLEYDQAFQ